MPFEGLRTRVMPRVRPRVWIDLLHAQAPGLALRLGPPFVGIWLFVMAWQLGHAAYGDFILPSPWQTLAAIARVLSSSEGWMPLAATMGRVIVALGLSVGIGGSLGLVSGYAPLIRATLAPISTILLGIPATAWVILTMIWFGPAHGAILFTIAIVTGPILYIGTVDAVMTRDRRLEDMAAAFGLGRWTQFRTIALRQILATLAPVMGIALALGFKVAIMAELVSNVAGLGASLAQARAHLDIDMALAYVALAVMGLLLVEHALVRPLQRRTGAWKRGTG